MVDSNNNDVKKHTLRNILLSTIFTIGGFIVGAIVSNLVIVNRLDEKVRGIEVILQRHELTSMVGVNKYERWLISIQEKAEDLNTRLAKLEANYEHLKSKVTKLQSQ